MIRAGIRTRSIPCWNFTFLLIRYSWMSIPLFLVLILSIHLEEAVENCDIFLAIIGSRWENIEDHKGYRRLENPEDFVRIEVAHALEARHSGHPSIWWMAPRCHTQMYLPENLKELARRHAFSIGDHMRSDVQRLIKVLERTFESLENERLEREKKESELDDAAQAKKERKEQEIAENDRKTNKQNELEGQEKSPVTPSLPLLKRIPVWVWPVLGALIILVGYGLLGGFSPPKPEVTETDRDNANRITCIKFDKYSGCYRYPNSLLNNQPNSYIYSCPHINASISDRLKANLS